MSQIREELDSILAKQGEGVHGMVTLVQLLSADGYIDWYEGLDREVLATFVPTEEEQVVFSILDHMAYLRDARKRSVQREKENAEKWKETSNLLTAQVAVQARQLSLWRWTSALFFVTTILSSLANLLSSA